MRLKLTLLITLLLVVAKSWGWSVGDQFTVNGITYKITDLNKYYVSVIAVSTDALEEGTNKVIIRLYRYCPWLRGRTSNRISGYSGRERMIGHVPL